MPPSQSVLVTGATGGIGSRVCRALLRSGTRVVGVVRAPDRFRALMAEDSWTASDFEVVAADFDGDVESALAGCHRSGCKLRGLVLIYPSVPKSAEILPPPEEWTSAFHRCFIQPLSLLRAALPMLETNARIVLVSGISSVQVFPTLPFSNAIRAAWLAEAKTLSFSLAPQRIRVNTLSLGGTLTEQFQARLAARQATDIPAEDSPENIPLGAYGDPEDVAAAICAMLGELTNHMTGANIVLDGGLTRVY